MAAMESELWATIRRLFEVEKLSRAAIARRLNVNRRTVRRAITSPEGPPRPSGSRRTGTVLLAPYTAHMEQRIKNYPELSGRKLFLEIREQGYAGGYTLVKSFLHPLRNKPKAFLRLETLPGEYAQVDWGHAGTIRIGNRTWRLSCFAMVLSHSRMLYLEFTLSQKLEDFMRCHVNAFAFFGGVPKRINYDNLKSVVLSRVGRDIRFHPRFMDFAGYYLFEPVPCNVRAAWEKRKVESAIKYVRSAFLAGRTITSWSGLNEEAGRWRDEEANVRIHGTTRERPVDRFAAEKGRLQPLPPRPYDTRVVDSGVETGRQALIHFDANRYTVPHALAGKTLTLKADIHQVDLYDGIRCVASHARCYEKHRLIENPDHHEGLLAARRKAKSGRIQAGFLALAPECTEYLSGLVQSELDLSAHVGKIMDMAALYGKTEVAGAVAHALRFKAFGAGYIQRIIHQRRAARDMPEPQPVVLTKKPDWNRLAVEQTDLAVYDELFEDRP
jgi:transposase